MNLTPNNVVILPVCYMPPPPETPACQLSWLHALAGQVGRGGSLGWEDILRLNRWLGHEPGSKAKLYDKLTDCATRYEEMAKRSRHKTAEARAQENLLSYPLAKRFQAALLILAAHLEHFHPEI